MPRIEQLTPQVVAQIAAGEVIERPASVAQGAAGEQHRRRQHAHRRRGRARAGSTASASWTTAAASTPTTCPGLRRPRHEQAAASPTTCPHRHARLPRRGTRVDRLVAQVSLQSRPPGLDRGAEVRCDGGELGEPRGLERRARARASRSATCSLTRPCARKFLRGPATEMGHVGEVVHRGWPWSHARAAPDAAAQRPGSSTTCPPAPACSTASAAFFGDEVRRQLYTVEGEHGPHDAGRLRRRPRLRTRRHADAVRVRQRPLDSRPLLSQALQEAYRGLLMTGKHPVAFVFLEVPPDAVDVNVHPTKAEVRFRQPQGPAARPERRPPRPAGRRPDRQPATARRRRRWRWRRPAPAADAHRAPAPPPLGPRRRPGARPPAALPRSPRPGRAASGALPRRAPVPAVAAASPRRRAEPVDEGGADARRSTCSWRCPRGCW